MRTRLAKAFGRLCLQVMTSFALALYVGLFANMISQTPMTWSAGIRRMGVWNVILALWVLSLLIQLIRGERRGNRHSDVLLLVVTKIFSVFCKSLEYPSDERKINCHYYSYTARKGKSVLVKQRAFAREVEPLPQNYPLETIDVDDDNLVTCDAFRSRKVVYEELPPDHVARYASALRDKVDPALRWVLACPVWFRTSEADPDGMIILFGRTPFIKSDEQRVLLEATSLEFSEIIASLLSLRESIRCGEVTS